MTNASNMLTVSVKFHSPAAAAVLRRVVALDFLPGFSVNERASKDTDARSIVAVETASSAAAAVSNIETREEESTRQSAISATSALASLSGSPLSEEKMAALEKLVDTVTDGMMSAFVKKDKKKQARRAKDNAAEDLDASSTSSVSTESGSASSRRSSSAPSRVRTPAARPVAVIEPVAPARPAVYQAQNGLGKMRMPPSMSPLSHRLPVSAPIAIVPVGQEQRSRKAAPLRACSYAITPVSSKQHTAPTAKLVLGQEPWEIEVEVKQCELELSPASTSFLRCKGFITWCRDDIKDECKWGHTCRYAHVSSKALRDQLIPVMPPIAPQMCPSDHQCKQVNDPEHQRQYRHTCRIMNCPDGHEAFHGIPFFHPGQVQARDAPRREIMLSPQSTTSSSQSSSAASSVCANMGSGGVGSYTNSPYAEDIACYGSASGDSVHSANSGGGSGLFTGNLSNSPCQYPYTSEMRNDTPTSCDFNQLPGLLPAWNMPNDQFDQPPLTTADDNMYGATYDTQGYY